MGWYDLAKTAQAHGVYNQIGHFQANNSRDCNMLWFISNQGFQVASERSFMDHGSWPAFHNIEYNNDSEDRVYFYGRIDACKKIASFKDCETCENAIGFINPMSRKMCSRKKIEAQLALHKQFGDDLIIRYFGNAQQF